MLETMEQWVLLDMDDVLGDSSMRVRQGMKAVTGKDIHPATWFDFNLCLVYQIDPETRMQAFFVAELLEKFTLYPEAVGTIKAIRAKGYKVGVITARKWHPDGEALTRKTFERHGVELDALHVVDHTESKLNVVMEHYLGKAVAYVDDNIDHVAGMRPAGIPSCMLLHRPWNAKAELLPNERRIQCVSQVLDVL